MKQFAILIAAIAMIGFISSESSAQCGYGGGSGFSISVGNAYGGGFSYAQGPYRSNYGVNIGGGYGGGYAPAYYRPVYRPVYRPPVVYSRYGYGGGGHYGGGRVVYGGYRGGCGY